MRKLILAALTAGILSLVAVAMATAHDDHSTDEWPMTCVDLNDIVEEHLGNPHNVGIYQNTFGGQAEVACQNDHRNDVIAVFGWAIADETGGQMESADLELDWPTTCVELNDIVEGHLGNQGNVAIYQNTFGDQAEAACQNDHRNDVRSVFAWAIGGDGSAPSPPPAATPAPPASDILVVQAAAPQPGPDPEREIVTVLTASGTGNGFTEPFFADSGTYQVIATVRDNQQNGNAASFTVDWKSRPNADQYITYHHSIVNEIVRNIEVESSLLLWSAGGSYFAIEAVGSWTITIRRVS